MKLLNLVGRLPKWVVALVLYFAASPWCLSQAPSIAVGDSSLQVILTLGADGPRESAFVIGGQALAGITAVPWAVQTDKEWVIPTSAHLAEPSQAAAQPTRRVTLAGQEGALAWRITYSVTGPGLVTKELELTAQQATRLKHVILWRANSPNPPAVARTALQDIAAFYRGPTAGLFASLDFPYSRCLVEGQGTTIGYPPYQRLQPGEVYQGHSLTIGATQLAGRKRYGWDLGEVAAMDAYVQQRFAPRFERPMLVGTSLINRYTMPQGGAIWYTYKNQPTLSFYPDLMREDFDLMARLGLEYYQFFPGVFDWAPGDPDPQFVRSIVAQARSRGVRVGDYSGCNAVFCPHYNEYNNHLDRPEWRMQDDRKQPGGFCFGCPEFVDYYITNVVPNTKAFGFQMHCMDFLSLTPCWAQNHGHPPGPDSVYHQVLGLVRFFQAINAIDPELMTWSNSGNWSEFLPKIAWWNCNLYLTDPFVSPGWQGLNMTRLLDDSRREQMVSLHYSRFLPFRFFSNAQYFLCQNSVVPEIRDYAYGALSTLAVTPNLGLAEIRPWLDTLPDARRNEVIAFYKKWTGFMRDHFDLWKTTCNAGEDVGPGSVEIYGHAQGGHGYIFLVNPNYWGRTVEVPLDSRLGFAGQGRCELVELHPLERRLLTARGPWPSLGSTLPLYVPARQVRVIEVRPAPEHVAAPLLYGLPGKIEATDGGWRLRTAGPQGTTNRFAVVMPDGAPTVTAGNVRDDVPKQAKRLASPTPLQMLGSQGQATLFEITFRRTPAPTDLRDWRVLPGKLDDGSTAKRPSGFRDGEKVTFPLFSSTAEVSLPLTPERADALGFGPLAGFCGGYVDNAFSEDQETWIDLRTNGVHSGDTTVASSDAMEPSRPIPAAARQPDTEWWACNTFHLPFMYTYGSEPAFDEHTILALPMLRPERVESLSAWVNGQPLEVQKYRYPRNRALWCFWADLVGSGAAGGQNTLVLHIRFKDDSRRK